MKQAKQVTAKKAVRGYKSMKYFQMEVELEIYFFYQKNQSDCHAISSEMLQLKACKKSLSQK